SATQAGAYASIGGTVAAPVIGPSSTTTSLGFFAEGILTGAPTISGSQNVGPAGAFPTLTAAAAAYNSRIQTGPVTFLLTDTSYTTGAGVDRTTGETFPITFNANPGASAVNTVTIKPAPATAVSISPLAATPTSIFLLNGADWVTIDGSNTAGGTTRDLTIANTNVSTTSAVIWGQTIGTADPATNNTIKNLNITGNASTTTIAGIGFGSSTISACPTAIATTSFTNDEVVNATVTGNTVNGVVETATFSAGGIVYGTPGYGTSRFANNMISGVVANGTPGDFGVGMFIGGTANALTQVFFNSVSMTGSKDVGGTATSPSYALAILGTNPLVDVR